MCRWTPNPVPEDTCFEAIKAGIDMMPDGVKMLLNSCTSSYRSPCSAAFVLTRKYLAEFYAQDLGPRNLELLARFFDAHPGYADKVFLSVKGGTRPGELVFDSSYVAYLFLLRRDSDSDIRRSYTGQRICAGASPR